jgi:hypothetical protein
MEAALVVALISSGSSLAVAAGTAVWTSRQQSSLELLKRRLDRQEKEEERRMDARAVLARYRVPLIDAASDLGHRIDNIRNGQFLAYLDGQHPRRETALLSTVYRLARYFGTLEILYERVNYLKFERDEDTRAVGAALADIGRTFATDEYDRAGPFYTSRLMVWREEQRAMGEVVRREGADVRDHCVGFATFAGNAIGPDAQWFTTFTSDLQAEGVANSERLQVLQRKLASLVRLLDDEGRYTDAGSQPDWIRRA